MCFMSTGALADKDADTTFSKGGCKTVLNGRCVTTGYREGKLYWLDFTLVSINTHIKTSGVSLDT